MKMMSLVMYVGSQLPPHNLSHEQIVAKVVHFIVILTLYIYMAIFIETYNDL